MLQWLLAITCSKTTFYACYYWQVAGVVFKARSTALKFESACLWSNDEHG